jgi:hypothetical protein
MPLVGKAAPAFECDAAMPDGSFKTVKLSDYKGEQAHSPGPRLPLTPLQASTWCSSSTRSTSRLCARCALGSRSPSWLLHSRLPATRPGLLTAPARAQTEINAFSDAAAKFEEIGATVRAQSHRERPSPHNCQSAAATPPAAA